MSVIFYILFYIVLIVGMALLLAGAKPGSENKALLATGGSIVAALVVGIIGYFSYESYTINRRKNNGEVTSFPPPLTWEGLIKSPAEMNAILAAESAKFGPPTNKPRKSRNRKNSRKDSRKDRKDRKDSRKN
jgi:hypothetical protein